MAFDFPASPTTGTLYQPAGGPTYRWNGTVWAVVAAQFQGAMPSDAAPANPVPGQLWWESDTGALFVYYDDGNSQQWVQVVAPSGSGLIQRQFITTSGAITLNANTRIFRVQVQGGGGGGGNAVAGSGSNGQMGSGGGAGGYCEKWIVKPTGTFTPTCTIGTGGASASAGTASSYSDGTNTLTANGGNAGAAGFNATGGTRVGGGGGSATGGDINATGDQGGFGFHTTIATTIIGMAQAGASSRFGAGGTGQVVNTASAFHNGGNAGNGRGSGGAGALNAFAGSAVPGGAGADGMVVIEEYR